MQTKNQPGQGRQLFVLNALSASRLIGVGVILVMVVCASRAMASGQSKSWVRQEVALRIGPDFRAVAVNAPSNATILAPRAWRSSGGQAERSIPIGGFAPYIAIGLTDARKYGEFLYAHELANYVTGTPLNPPMEQNYAIGILDTGATLSLVGGCDQALLGLTSEYLTGNTIPIGGASGTIDADVTHPLGMFAAGLQEIDPATLALDTAAMSGHWHVSVAVVPEETCGDDMDIPCIVSTALLAFKDVVIRNDSVRTVIHNGRSYAGPEIDIYPAPSGQTPNYAKDVPLDLRPVGLTIAAYYPDILNLDFETPWIPTSLAAYEMAIPSGGWFYASVRLEDGDSGELAKDFMVDTGAQVSVIRSFIAGQLGLDPENPDFTIEIADVTGGIEVVPGFYLDTFKIDAFGGPVVFSQVPVIMKDITSIEGGTLDGIVGMNMFFDRNLVFRPDVSGGSIMEISDPIVFPPDGDFDHDGDVDLSDFIFFANCLEGPDAVPNPIAPTTVEDCLGTFDFDEDNDVDLSDFAPFQTIFTG